MYVFIVANSPGEIIGWVRPVAKSLKERHSDIEVFLIIPPCQYSTGKEEEVARSFSEVRHVLGPGDYIKYIFLGRTPSFISKAKGKEGVCVFLGGDPFHAVIVSRKLGLPAVAYIQRPRWSRQFEKFMVLNHEIKDKNFLQKGIKPGKVVVVGDLMVDSVRLHIEEEKICSSPYSFSERPVISIMPGSRPQIAQNMTLFFLKTCELIRESFPGAVFFLLLSPFIEKKDFFNLSRAKINKILDVPQTGLSQEKGQWKLTTSTGLKVVVVTKHRHSIMSFSDIAVTIPGTNTTELACLGVPMLVALPLNRPEMIPLDGLAGLVGRIPYLGTFVKRGVVKVYGKKVRFAALPNIRAGKEIVPEVRGEIEPENVANKAVELLQERKKLSSISSELKKAVGQEGAAGRVADVILRVGERRN